MVDRMSIELWHVFYYYFWYVSCVIQIEQRFEQSSVCFLEGIFLMMILKLVDLYRNIYIAGKYFLLFDNYDVLIFVSHCDKKDHFSFFSFEVL